MCGGDIIGGDGVQAELPHLVGRERLAPPTHCASGDHRRCLHQHRGHAQRLAGAQQVLTVMISGVGPLAGFLSAGWTAQFLTDPATGLVDYRTFWLVPGVLCALIALWLFVGFHERRAPRA